MDRSAARRATLLIMALFLLQPIVIGGWLALIPQVKESLGLSKGQLAFALLGMPLALIPSLQVAGKVIGASGPRRVFMAAFPAQAVVVLLPLLAWDGLSLFFALAALGGVAAFLEVGINVYAGRLEKQARLNIMNRCHGFWALGIATGSFGIALMAEIPPIVALTGLAVVSAILGVMAAYAAPRLGEEGGGKAPPRRKPRDLPPALIYIALFMFLVTLAEGAMADWAAVYVAERMGGVAPEAGLAVTVFSGFMAGGRFMGDWLKRVLGAVRHAQVTIGSAVAGLALIVLPLPLAAAWVGFALVGFGVSSAYPLGVSAIAALDDRYEAANIAIMATVALGGFLVGPPLIGSLAERFTLSVGLTALLPGLIVALWLTRWLKPSEEGEDSPRVGPDSAPE